MSSAAAELVKMGVNGTFELPKMLEQLANGSAVLGKDGAAIAGYLNTLKDLSSNLGIKDLESLANLKGADLALGGLAGAATTLLNAFGGKDVKDVAAALAQVQQGLGMLGLKVDDVSKLLEGDLAGIMGKDTDFSDLLSGKMPDLVGAIVDKLWDKLPPEVQTALTVGKQLLEAFGLPGTLKGMVTEALKKPEESPAPPPVVPGVWVEKHYIATLTKAFAIHDGQPLLPGPGAPTVISEGNPVWRANVDQHLCKVPAPGHGPGSVKVGAKTVLAEGQQVSRFGDILIGEAAPNQIIDAVTAAKVRAAIAKAKAEEEARKRKAAAEKAAKEKAEKEAAEKGKKRGPLTREEREARKKEIAERRAREKRAEDRNARAQEASRNDRPAPAPGPTPDSNVSAGSSDPDKPNVNPNSPVGTGPDPVPGPAAPQHPSQGYPTPEDPPANEVIAPPNGCGPGPNSTIDRIANFVVPDALPTSLNPMMPGVPAYIGDICDQHDKDYSLGGSWDDWHAANDRFRDRVYERLIQSGADPITAAVHAKAYHTAVEMEWARNRFTHRSTGPISEDDYQERRRRYDQQEAERRDAAREAENERRRKESDEAVKNLRSRDQAG